MSFLLGFLGALAGAGLVALSQEKDFLIGWFNQLRSGK